MSPLKSVYWSEIHFLAVLEAARVEKLPRTVGIPDLNATITEVLGVGATTNKPEELLGNATPEDTFGGEEREDVVAQVEAHLRAKEREGAGASAILPLDAARHDLGNQIQVLIFSMSVKLIIGIRNMWVDHI